MATKKKNALAAAETALREFATAYPETHEAFPWGELAVKVKGKAFIFMRGEEQQLSLSVKLPSSRDMAIDLPFAKPTGYGLGKSGWVTATFAAGDDVPVDLLKAWIDESYRAVAPKKLSAQLPKV
jgi:predicted DNA-binding protein (MmcQ/YjbR family)